MSTGARASGPRSWVWVQLLAAWVPMWALFTALIVIAHGAPFAAAAMGALQMIVAAAIAAIPAYRFTLWRPWPHPFRITFIAEQVAAAAVYAVSWFLLISGLQSVILGQRVLVIGPGIERYLFTGMWLYFAVAGVAYANHAAQRAARLEANAARSQLGALRAQLHPHFLFNALHAVVQLIPVDPQAATRAAEQLAAALRTALDERRDVVALADEWAFVERYLDIESIRFGDRLKTAVDIEAAARGATLPSFALQTLVENAVRHGAAPKVGPTHVRIRAWMDRDDLKVTVVDDGGGADAAALEASAGGGLARLRERMRWLYGEHARLELGNVAGTGLSAALTVPQARHG